MRGLDYSPAMVEAARAKHAAAGRHVEVVVGDAGDPPYDDGSVDVVLVRHVLWAMPDPAEALRRWIALLRPGGRMVLVEGRWHTGGGISAVDCAALVGAQRDHVEVRQLPEPVLWGGPITDERYVLVTTG